MLGKVLERIVDYLQGRLRPRKWKIEAFKLCERCEKFYSFDPVLAHIEGCTALVEVRKGTKDTFLRKVSEELSQKTRQELSAQREHLLERIRNENKYIKWGWKFCPNCYSTDWGPAYHDRLQCKRCGKIFT